MLARDASHGARRRTETRPSAPHKTENRARGRGFMGRQIVADSQKPSDISESLSRAAFW